MFTSTKTTNITLTTPMVESLEIFFHGGLPKSEKERVRREGNKEERR